MNDIGMKSVYDEKVKILKAEQTNEEFEGLRILGCSKTYKIADNCCESKNVYALKDVS